MSFTETDAPVVVIGYGNVLRGDDGAGPAAAELLREALPQQVAEVLSVHQLLPELSQRVSRSRLAIFIDADWNRPAGEVHAKTVEPGRTGRKAIGHHQSPENLLTMAAALYSHAPRAILFQVGAADFGFRQGLSHPVKEAIARLVRQVADTVIEAAANPAYTGADGTEYRDSAE
jgi:hydrogenase maturation protease